MKETVDADRIERRGDAWHVLASRRWASTMDRARAEVRTGEEQSAADAFGECVYAALSHCPEKLLSRGKDLDVMKRAVSSIVEATQEDILTQEEADAVLEFLAEKFVERRFASLMHHVFDIGPGNLYTFKKFRGEFK